ncbi:MAG TPA: alpha-amylase family glycosyl hydrolase, partial [Herpetosiphonaceae bacterium]|nr:alpha-amylase family glycosyl hydrolase [Herpetosiphonaceae bacterium]
MSAQVNVTQDFIFGTMATDELRLAAMAAEGRGVFHGNQISPTDPEPDQPVEVLVSTGTDVAAETVTLFYTLNGEDPSPSSPRVDLVPGEVVWDTLLWGYRRTWRGMLPAQPEGVHVRYRIAAQGTGGEPVWAEPDPSTGRPATFAYHVDREHVPAWIRDAVIYHIFVDRFYPGEGRSWNDASTFNDFWGGTLRGIIEQLPYLEELGVTCLWLSPVFPSPSHHGYDATDYFHVEPRLGTDDDLRDLLALAHARGMRVLLDYVANHVSNEHPAFRKATSDPTAPERAWFTFGKWPEEYRSFFGVRSLPQIDNEHLAARRHIIDGARYWLEQGADGFRLDYANGPTHGFWTQFRAETRAVEPESFTVGEIVETAELQRSYQGRLDGVLDFLLLQQMRAFFAFDIGSPRTFDTFLRRHLEFFPADFVLPSFLDNHDMNRFLWVVRGDTRRLRLAALCQMTLPHPPIVYYGTEVGLSQRRDLQYPDGSRRMEESRTPMPWGDEQDAGLLAFYRRLIALRRAHGGLWRGRRVTLAA